MRPAPTLQTRAFLQTVPAEDHFEGNARRFYNIVQGVLVSPVRTFFHNFLRLCVHKVSQVGAEQARIELQVVILEWLGTAAKLTVHLAQVSQVDQVQRQVVRWPSSLVGRWPGGQVAWPGA